MTVSALAASSSIIIPVVPNFVDVASLGQVLTMNSSLLDTIRDAGMTLDYDVLRYLVSRFGPSDGPQAQVAGLLRANFGKRVMTETYLKSTAISDTGPQDRLGNLDDDVAALRDGIATYRQQVPIPLQPHAALSGRYLVIYGRRRLSAKRGPDVPVKALIRTLSGQEAVLAQRQESNLHKDPSFIEKAQFAGAF